ncbi:MAG: hypothetical protein JO119_18285 [Acidobacteria bacterium]|nr:hypothetical protein [Acidobacteriota bacterium]
MLTPSASGYFEFRVITSEEDYPELSEISYFLHDLNLLYEFTRIETDPAYSGYRFSRFFGYRNRSRLVEADRLHIERLNHQSPFELVAIVTATSVVAGALWVLVQTIEKLVNLGPNRELLKLNVEKIKAELNKAPASKAVHELQETGLLVSKDLGRPSAQIDRVLTANIEDRLSAVDEKEAQRRTIERHLSESPIRVIRIEIEYVEFPRKKKQDR